MKVLRYLAEKSLWLYVTAFLIACNIAGTASVRNAGLFLLASLLCILWMQIVCSD